MKRNIKLFYDIDEGMSGFGGELTVQAADVIEAMAKAREELIQKYMLPPTAEIILTDPDELEA